MAWRDQLRNICTATETNLAGGVAYPLAPLSAPYQVRSASPCIHSPCVARWTALPVNGHDLASTVHAFLHDVTCPSVRRRCHRPSASHARCLTAPKRVLFRTHNTAYRTADVSRQLSSTGTHAGERSGCRKQGST